MWKTNREGVERLLEELVGLDLCHAGRRGALPLDEDLAQLVRDLLQREAQRKQHVRALVVGQRVAQRVHAHARGLQEELAALHAQDHPLAVGRVRLRLLAHCVGDAHCLLFVVLCER